MKKSLIQMNTEALDHFLSFFDAPKKQVIDKDEEEFEEEEELTEMQKGYKDSGMKEGDFL